MFLATAHKPYSICVSFVPWNGRSFADKGLVTLNVTNNHCLCFALLLLITARHVSRFLMAFK